MHELSIAISIMELAEEEAERRGVQVNIVHLKLGALFGVVKEALLSCYEMAFENTPLQGSRLLVEDVPVVIFCPSCRAQRAISGSEQLTRFGLAP
jgi:hydrogenase nickel incorporation protein HypA/HybF